MATIPVYTPAGTPAGEMELAAAIFGVEACPELVHQAVVTTLANMRQGTADTKSRGEVNYSTRKMWRQKGTGRARQGMRSAPHWKGGGVAFGPTPRDYSLGLNKKMRRKALLSAISAKVADEKVKVVDTFGMSQPKTKDAAALLKALGLDGKKVLIVLDQITEEIVLSFRNLPRVYMTTVNMLGTYDVLHADTLLFTRAGIEMFQALKQQPFGAARRMMAAQGGAE